MSTSSEPSQAPSGSPSDSPPPTLTEEGFKRLEGEIQKHWQSSPILPSDINTTTAFDYAERHIRTNPVNEVKERQHEFRALLKEKVAKLLGAEIAESVTKQLGTNHSIGTAQHYIPLSPNTLNATLFSSLPYFGSTEADRQNVIVLGCAGVSISNPWYARGNLFHALINNEIIENQLNFFGRALDSVPVIHAPALTRETQKVMTKTVMHFRSHQLVKKREFNRLLTYINEIVFTKEVLGQKTYVDQLTIANFHLWQKIFSGFEGNIPNLVFVAQEEIAKELIKKHHLHSESIVHNIIFNKEWHELIYKYFNNITCAFSVEKQYGTFLFWAISKETKSRTQLFMKDGVLSSLDGSVRLEVTPENIERALTNEEILPNVMLTFIILSMYYGYYLSGGLLQPAYLTQIKEAYTKMMQELGNTKEAENASQIITNDATLPRPAMAFLDGPNNQREVASGLDLYLYGNANSWANLIDAMKKMPFNELYYRMYPGIYKTLCKNPDKYEELLAITERQIEQFTEIDKKIPAWANLMSPQA